MKNLNVIALLLIATLNLTIKIFPMHKSYTVNKLSSNKHLLLKRKIKLYENTLLKLDQFKTYISSKRCINKQIIRNINLKAKNTFKNVLRLLFKIKNRELEQIIDQINSYIELIDNDLELNISQIIKIIQNLENNIIKIYFNDIKLMPRNDAIMNTLLNKIDRVDYLLIFSLNPLSITPYEADQKQYLGMLKMIIQGSGSFQLSLLIKDLINLISINKNYKNYTEWIKKISSILSKIGNLIEIQQLIFKTPLKKIIPEDLERIIKRSRQGIEFIYNTEIMPIIEEILKNCNTLRNLRSYDFKEIIKELEIILETMNEQYVTNLKIIKMDITQRYWISETLYNLQEDIIILINKLSKLGLSIDYRKAISPQYLYQIFLYITSNLNRINKNIIKKDIETIFKIKLLN